MNSPEFDKKFIKNILHEGGHIIGLKHEHSWPFRENIYDIDKL